MKDMQAISPFCRGTMCPLKIKCARYVTDIEFGKADYLPSVPYDPKEEKCEFYLGTMPNDVWRQVTDMIKANNDNPLNES